MVGEWEKADPDPFPIFPVHSHMLPTGKVMLWPGDGISGNDPRSWDPATETISDPYPQPGSLTLPGYDVFCTGHSFLADGRLFVAGGQVGAEIALDWRTQVSMIPPRTFGLTCPL